MRSTTPPTSRRTARITTPATWRWCAAASPRSRWCSLRRRRRSRSEVNARRGRYKRIHLPERFGGAASADHRGDRHAPRGPAARPLHRAAAGRGGEERARAQRAGAAVPQPPRLRAADAVPRLRLPPAMPELRRLAGRSPLQAAAGLSPLRLRHAAAGGMPAMPGDRELRRPSVPAWSGWSRRRPNCFPGARILVLSSDLVESMERLRAELDDVARRPLRHRHRHPARRQGPPFSQAQSGRHRRRRSRPRQRRPARRRAHLPASAPGGRPRRPRGGARRRLSADASARTSGDAGADPAATARRSMRARSRCAKRPAIRRSDGSPAWS